MWKVVAILITYHLSLIISPAQTFTQRIQQPAAGQGTVTIHQNTDIDQLVNNAQLAPMRSATTTLTPGTKPDTNDATAYATTANTATANTANPATATTSSDTAEPIDAPVDYTKKIMRGGVKINGYRVQAFAGGNSRKDRLKAEQIGNKIKANYPNEPVYVHFYTPRWICRIGNYRTYEEAHQMLVSVRKLGYTQATIVKGKITVQY
ncbi:MAG: SPOR domain-containing protein [Prevotella sp.]|nr:SPOR domain-containing protein [Prevotella sp.]